MEIPPLPKVIPNRAADIIEQVLAKLQGIRNEPPDEWLTGYTTWVTTSSWLLLDFIDERSVRQLVLTPGYYGLMSGSHEVGDQPLNRLVGLEMEIASRKLQAALDHMRERHGKTFWPGRELVVADTSVYMHGPSFDEMSGSTLLGKSTPIQLLVPMTVIDELDNLKDRGRDDARWRARLTLKAIMGTLRSESLEGSLLDHVDGVTSAIEVVPDPPAHVRLPIADDEIVARAAVIARFAGRRVHLVSRDKGMLLRAVKEDGLEPVEWDEDASSS